MFAILETGGKQYKVSVGDKIKVERLDVSGESVSFPNVLLVSNGDTATIGKPAVKGATVTGKLLKQARARKVIVFKYHSKARYRKKKGHRQEFSEVEITHINS